MKNLRKVSIAVAISLLVALFASCSPTMFMDQLEPSDVTVDWVQGKWSGKLVTYEAGEVKTTDDSYVYDLSNKLVATGATLTLAAIATTGDLYANSARTHIIYQVKNGDITYDYNLTKTK